MSVRKCAKRQATGFKEDGWDLKVPGVKRHQDDVCLVCVRAQNKARKYEDGQ